MIVSHQKKFIFFHNPKCGGSSIRKVLLQYADNDKFRYHGYVNRRLYPLSHLPGSVAIQVLRHEVSNFSEYKVVMLYRDPLQRFISAAGEFELKYRDWYQKFNLPVRDFLLQVLTPESLQLPHFGWFRHQSAFWPFFPSPGPLRRLFAVEELDSNWKELLDYLNLPYDPLPVENSGASRVRLSSEDPEVQSRVAMLYGRDYRWLSEVRRLNGLPELYTKPIESVLPTDSYLWGIHSVKRVQAGDAPAEALGPLTPDLQAAMDTPLQNWRV